MLDGSIEIKILSVILNDKNLICTITSAYLATESILRIHNMLHLWHGMKKRINVKYYKSAIRVKI